MNGNQPVLIVQTSSGQAKLDLAKVTSVGEQAAATTSVKNEGKIQAPANQAPIVAEASKGTEETDELDQLWRGFPPFASFESIQR